MENKNVPRVRFEGFNDAWEQRKLKTLVEINPHSVVPNIFEYVDLESVVGNSLINHRTENIKNAPSRAQRVAQKGDIFFQTVRPYQKNNYLFNLLKKDYVFSTGYAQLRPNENGYFLIAKLQNDNFVNEVMNMSTGTSYPAITSKDLGNIKIKTTNISEQLTIGLLFKKIDQTIASNQRKLDSLKKVKKAMMQKIFDQTWRFEGFTDPWEQRKLKNITNRVTRKNGNLESEKPLTISAQDGLIAQNEFFDKTIASKDVSGYYLIRKGEFAYNKSYSKGYPFGAVKRLERYEAGVLSTLYIVFELKGINSQFMSTYYDSTYWYYQIYLNAAEGARNHGLLNISSEDFFNSIIFFPSINEEQELIGTMFKNINKTIASNQLKIDKLKETKKWLMQNMFV